MVLRRGPRVGNFFFDQSIILTTNYSPMIGGSLSRPTERFPDTFGNSEFLRNYPYFLPCAVSATFSAFAWIMTLVFLREVGMQPNFCWTSTYGLHSRQFLLPNLFAPF